MKIFVIMPFSETTYKDAKHTEEYWNAFYNELCVIVEKNNETIKNMFNNPELKIFRAAAPQGNVVESILWNLVESEIVFAVLTDYNPNVFYELGARHVNRIGTIMLCQDGQKIPFDLDNYGAAVYKDDESKFQTIEKEILNRLRQISGKPEKSDNPFFDFVAGKDNPRKSLKPEIKIAVVDKLEKTQVVHVPQFYREFQPEGYRDGSDTATKIYFGDEDVKSQSKHFTGRTFFSCNLQLINTTGKNIPILDTKLKISLPSGEAVSEDAVKKLSVDTEKCSVAIHSTYIKTFALPAGDVKQERALFVLNKTFPKETHEIKGKVCVMDVNDKVYETEDIVFKEYKS